MDLACGVSAQRLAAFGREASSAIVGTATNFPIPQVSGAVPAMDLGDAFRTEICLAIPTLVFSSDLDLRTPVEEQVTATAGLTRVMRVQVHGGGHDLFEAQPTMPGLIADFFAGRAIAKTDIAVPLPSPKS